jgi:glycosyltransferase involved in cell wall biosynthesis
MDASIIIPTYNRKDALLETLKTLVQVDYPAGAWEAVVFDDGSTDGTDEAIQKWIDETKAPVRFFKQQNAGPARARNRGAEEARGDFLIFIDNDILVKPDFIRQHVETLKSNPGCWVVGRVVHPPQLRDTPFGRYRDDVWEQFHQSHATENIVETNGITAANLSLPKKDFGTIGNFDESFTIASCEDWELGMRARIAGIKALYHPGIVTLHNDWAVDLRKFCERQRLYSISDVLLWRKYGEASPRVRMIQENSPVVFGKDSMRLIAKKIVKSALATKQGQGFVFAACRFAEKFLPDSRLNRKVFETAIGTAIFRGVREGLKRYPEISRQ